MITIAQNSIYVLLQSQREPQGKRRGRGRSLILGDLDSFRRGEHAGVSWGPKGLNRGVKGRGGEGRRWEGRGGEEGWTGEAVAAGEHWAVGARRGGLTAAECGLAVPDVQVGGLPAGLPEGQVVLVVRCDPRRAQHCSQVQTQRQKDAHEPDQLERGQH